MKTYTPGYFNTKLISAIISLAICAVGIAEMWFPAMLVFQGRVTKGVVVKIEKTSPGLKTEVYTTTASIPDDKNRSAIFWHFVEYVDTTGQERTAKLNIATKIKPAQNYAVGTKISIACPKNDPQAAVAVFDWQTWSLGFFILIVGFVYASVSILFVLTANKPIELQDESADVNAAANPPPAA